jgi:heme/copper-type cytochrome/quinol oxidase subunit 2
MLFTVKIVEPEEYKQYLAGLKAAGQTGHVRDSINMPAPTGGEHK